MGYRSDIRGLFYAVGNRTPENWATIKLWLQANMPEDVVAYEFDDELMEMEFNAGWVKWYDTFPEVQAFEKLLTDFEEVFVEQKEGAPEGAFEFLRIGEEMDDNEHRNSDNADCRLQIVRSIERI